MDKRNLNWVTWGFLLLGITVMGLMLSGSLRRSSHITLPPPGAGTSQATEEDPFADNVLTVVEITPETVQAAIESLYRPERYRRTVTVEQIWNGGSGIYEIYAAVSGNWTRTDRTFPNGPARHTITDGQNIYIWYDGEDAVYAAPSGNLPADTEQFMPTYEDILELPTEDILTADYRMLLNIRCIYVETAEREGHTMRFWVSVEKGLLIAAERLAGENTVYRMGAPSLDETEPTLEDFTLPDGTVLFRGLESTS